MCSILGFFNPGRAAHWNADRILPELLFVNQLRGRDAVGAFCQKKDGHDGFVDHLKMIGPVDQFLNWKDPHDRLIKEAEHMRFVVAHTRAATIGAKESMDAAHPHVTENIILVHNGTLRKYPDKAKFSSDSQAVAHMLEEADGDFLAVEREIDGAWVFVWWDKRSETLNFVRNNQRPLNFARTADGALWFASEAKSLEWILDRNNKTIVEKFPLKERTWIKWGLDGKIKEVEVPFVHGKHRNSRTSEVTERELTPEQFGALPETKRAFATILGGKGAVRSFKDCDVECAEVPKEVAHPTSRVLALPAPSSGSGGYSRLPQDQKPNLRQIEILDRYASMKIGDEIHFWPLHYFAATRDSNNVAMAGPLIVFGGDGGVEPVAGVEIRGRLCAELDDETPVIQKILRLSQNPRGATAIITQICHDKGREKVILWTKECDPQDWFDDSMGLKFKDLENAWMAKLPHAAAPEVAAIEKKSSTAGHHSC